MEEDSWNRIIVIKRPSVHYKCDNFYHPEDDGASFSKTYPQWSLHPLRFPHLWGTETFFTIKEECFSNHPVPLSKEGSTFSPSPSSSGSGDVTALRCSEPLRYKVGGASKPSPCCAGWDRQGVKA